MRQRTGTGFHLASILVAATAPVFVALFVWQRPLLDVITVEDGPAEYLSAVFYFAAALLFALAGLRGVTSRWWMVPLVVLSVLVGGEEISWGQRLFGFGTPESLADANVQGEVNLHNIEGVHGTVRAAVVLFFLVGFVLLPLAVRFWPVVAAQVSRLRFPVPPLVLAPLVLVAVAFMVGDRLIPLGDGEIFMLDEVGELYLSTAWVLFAWAVWTGRPRRAPGGQLVRRATTSTKT